MPVVRGEAKFTPISDERRREMLNWLKDEIGKSTPGGPAIYEIPFDSWDRIDVIVVWDEFNQVSSMDRTNLIMEAYVGRQSKIAQALGVTYQEAIEQNLLPYAVQPMNGSGEVDTAELRKAMIEEGAMLRPGDKIELRFPSKNMAKAAYQRLCKKIPQGAWLIRESPDLDD
jgi:hypothetical protein